MTQSRSSFQWQGRERCEILLTMKKDAQSFTAISQQDRATLLWAIDKLLEQYGCNYSQQR